MLRRKQVLKLKKWNKKVSKLQTQYPFSSEIYFFFFELRDLFMIEFDRLWRLMGAIIANASNEIEKELMVHTRSSD